MIETNILVKLGYEGIQGGNGYGDRNEEGDIALDFAVANNFVICNTFFRKRDLLPTILVSLKPRLTLSWLESLQVYRRCEGDTK